MCSPTYRSMFRGKISFDTSTSLWVPGCIIGKLREKLRTRKYLLFFFHCAESFHWPHSFRRGSACSAALHEAMYLFWLSVFSWRCHTDVTYARYLSLKHHFVFRFLGSSGELLSIGRAEIWCTQNVSKSEDGAKRVDNGATDSLPLAIAFLFPMSAVSATLSYLQFLTCSWSGSVFTSCGVRLSTAYVEVSVICHIC